MRCKEEMLAFLKLIHETMKQILVTSCFQHGFPHKEQSLCFRFDSHSCNFISAISSPAVVKWHLTEEGAPPALCHKQPTHNTHRTGVMCIFLCWFCGNEVRITVSGYKSIVVSWFLWVIWLFVYVWWGFNDICPFHSEERKRDTRI